MRILSNSQNKIFEKGIIRARSYLLAIAMMLLALLSVSIGTFRRRERIPTSILYSVSRSQIIQSDSIEDFIDSVTEERFQAFYDTKKLLIEVRALKSILLGHKKVTFDAPIYLVTKCMKRRSYPAFVRQVLIEIANFKYEKVMDLREAKTQFFDFALYGIFGRTTDAAIDLITTNSSLSRLPSSFHYPLKGKRIMLWYSTNSKPFKYRNSEAILHWNPNYIKTKIDLHLVWTKFDVGFLQSLGIQNTQVVGPIVFQRKIMSERNSHLFIITYFDVTPVAKDLDWAFGGLANFYSEDNALKDLVGFMEISKYLRSVFGDIVKFRIKPKRAYGPLHSKLYQKKITQASKYFGVEILEPHSNLYSIVSQSDVVLSSPWSSPCVLAKEMHVETAYFSFRNGEWELPSEYEGIDVIKSPKDLTEFLIGKCKLKFSSC